MFTFYILYCNILYCGPDSSVGIAAELRAGRSGIESWMTTVLEHLFWAWKSAVSQRCTGDDGLLTNIYHGHCLRPWANKIRVNKAYKAPIYTTLRALSIAMTPTQGIRINKLWPHADWKVIWKNLVETPTSEDDIAIWYKVINDTIPTSERLLTL